jgi:hypothetical protein
MASGSIALLMTTRAEALEVLAGGHGEVRRLLDGIPDAALVAPATIGGGDWSAKDLLGHLTTWEEIALATVDEWRRGQRPSIVDTFAVDGTDDLNAREVERKAAASLEDLRRRFGEVHEQIEASIAEMSDDEWSQPAFWQSEQDLTLGSALGGILGTTGLPFGHVAAHERDLRAFADAQR